MAESPPSAYLHPMRQAAYILTLIVIWLISLAAIALGLDGFEHPPFVPHALLAGGYFGAVATVSLAEEIAERIGRPRLPAELPVGAPWEWRTRIPSLLRSCGPTAIAGFVVTVGVNAVNGVLW